MYPLEKITKLDKNLQISEIGELRRENERLRLEKESLDREKQEANRNKFQHTKKLHRCTDKLGANDIKKIIPAYDPSKNEFDSRGWIKIVDNIRNKYDWSDRDTMLYASFRMEKAARTWYLGRGAGIIRWSEFKEKLMEVFPERKSPNKSEENKEQSEICYHCRESGHLARHYENADKEVFYEMRFVKSNSDSCGGLIKQVKVDNVSVQAFLDLGSDTTTIKSLETFTYNWKPLPCNVKLIGIGGTSTAAIGRLIKSVNVDGVVVKNIEIYVVPDEFQEYPMILGRNFWNSSNVCVIKKFDSVEVMYANDMV